MGRAGYWAQPSFIRHGVPDVLLPDWTRKSVIFVGIKDADGKFHPRGTGFFVATNIDGFWFHHAVTAQHVVTRLQAQKEQIWIRNNLKGGGAEVELAPHWFFHPNRTAEPTDVAVAAFNDEHKNVDYNAIPLMGGNAMPALPDVICDNHIGLGDEVFIVGLFKSHYGAEKNIPIVRIGHICAMRDEPVKTKSHGFIDAYLVEAQSIGGLSGAPVIVSMPPFRIVDGKTQTHKGLQFYCLGLVHGHFDIENLNEDVVVEDLGAVSRGIHTGIGVVVPVEKIIETIVGNPDLAQMRKEAIDEALKGGAMPDHSDGEREKLD